MMPNRDYRDIIGGALLAATGLFVAVYSLANYELGTLGHMDSGMFPTALGFILAALGLLIALPGFWRAGYLPSIECRPLFAVSASVLAFALIAEPFGMVPAIMLLTVVAVLADNQVGPLATVTLAVVIAGVSVIVFRFGLGILLPPFNWPF